MKERMIPEDSGDGEGNERNKKRKKSDNRRALG